MATPLGGLPLRNLEASRWSRSLRSRRPSAENHDEKVSFRGNRDWVLRLSFYRYTLYYAYIIYIIYMYMYVYVYIYIHTWIGMFIMDTRCTCISGYVHRNWATDTKNGMIHNICIYYISLYIYIYIIHILLYWSVYFLVYTRICFLTIAYIIRQ